MNCVYRPILMFLFVTFATHLGASTLSVVPLGESLKNPALIEINPESDDYTAAVDAVTKLLLNKPTEDELAPLQQRLSDLARHRDTRVGKLFFAALAATPAIENLPEGATTAGINVTWPLALGATIRVRAEFAKSGDDWLISEFELTVDGVAGSPIAGMAPYFGKGEIRPLLLDLEAIDYVMGRDAEDRRRPETERKPFNYDEALTRIFESEEGAVAQTLNTLAEKVVPGADVEDRQAALKPHLATRAEREAIDAAGDNLEFWSAIYKQLEATTKLARPDAMPVREGAVVRINWTKDGEPARAICIRLEGGNVAVRDRAVPPSAPTPERNNEEGNGSGN